MTLPREGERINGLDEQHADGRRSAGGVTLTGYGSRIVVNNTLDERLRLLEEKVRRRYPATNLTFPQMLPEIRETLFGKVRTSSPSCCVPTDASPCRMRTEG